MIMNLNTHPLLKPCNQPSLSPRFVPNCNFCFGNTGRRTPPRPRSMINASRFNPERQRGRASEGGGHFTSPATVASSASPSAAATHTPSPLFSCQSKSRSSVRLLAPPFFAGVGVSGMSSPSLGLDLSLSHATTTELDPLLLLSLPDPQPGRTDRAKNRSCQRSAGSAVGRGGGRKEGAEGGEAWSQSDGRKRDRLIINRA